MIRYRNGERVIFEAIIGRKFAATVVDRQVQKGKIDIQLDGDPFPVSVSVDQIHREGATEMATTTRGPEARRLAKEAKNLGIRGYLSMSGAQLKKAVAQAQKAKSARKTRPVSKPAKKRPTAATVTKRATTKKKVARRAAVAVKRPARKQPVKKTTAAKKRAAPASKVAPNGINPFRVDSNLYLMTEELLRGGLRADMVKRLKRKMHLQPWSKDEEEDPDRAINKRLLMTAASLKNDYGFKIKREGRGVAGTIIATKGRKPSGQASKKRASSSRKTTSKKR